MGRLTIESIMAGIELASGHYLYTTTSLSNQIMLYKGANYTAMQGQNYVTLRGSQDDPLSIDISLLFHLYEE